MGSRLHHLGPLESPNVDPQPEVDGAVFCLLRDPWLTSRTPQVPFGLLSLNEVEIWAGHHQSDLATLVSGFRVLSGSVWGDNMMAAWGVPWWSAGAVSGRLKSSGLCLRSNGAMVSTVSSLWRGCPGWQWVSSPCPQTPGPAMATVHSPLE